jgi:hypothetical protein
MSDDLLCLSTLKFGDFVFVCAAEPRDDGYLAVAMCRSPDTASGVIDIPTGSTVFATPLEAAGHARFLATQWAVTRAKDV